jgi:hypothetical protein
LPPGRRGAIVPRRTGREQDTGLEFFKLTSAA